MTNTRPDLFVIVRPLDVFLMRHEPGEVRLLVRVPVRPGVSPSRILGALVRGVIPSRVLLAFAHDAATALRDDVCAMLAEHRQLGYAVVELPDPDELRRMLTPPESDLHPTMPRSANRSEPHGL